MLRFISITLICLVSLAVSAKPAKNNNDAFTQVNIIREAAKLQPLTYSSALSRSAQNHANYISKNIGQDFVGIDLHSETKSYANYTGEDVTVRAQHAGYPHKDVKENISLGSKNISDSVEGLMSGIYHRFTFLDFLIDTIGYGTASNNKEYKSYVYNMGRKDMESLCKTRPIQAKPQKPINCLGTTVSAEYMERACNNLPQEALYDAPFSQRCSNGRLLKSSYMNAVCDNPPAASIFNGKGSYYKICQPSIRVNTSWFNQLCSANGSPALHSGDHKFYKICEGEKRVYSSWLKNYCDSATPADQPSQSMYYTKPCHSDYKVNELFTHRLDDKQFNKNPRYVKWPAFKAKNVLPVFFDEIPDPLPDLNVSGYPLSLQFNEGKVKKVSVRYFTLDRKTKSGHWRRIKKIRELNYITDPEKNFTKHQFAWYPLKRLDWNTDYRASVYAKIDGIEKEIRWRFKTQHVNTPLFKIKPRGKSVTVPEDKWFTLYVVPSKSSNRPMKKINLKWRGSIKVESDIIDFNTIKIKLENTDCRPVYLNMEKGRVLVLNTCGN